MRSIFDEEKLQPPPAHDTELTLGSGVLLTIFLGLVLLCGLCFGAGYVLGHSSSATAGARPRAATDQEPLQASGKIPKPSAVAQTPVTAPPDQTAADPGASSTVAVPGAATQPQQPIVGTPSETGGALQPQVHPAMTSEAAQQPSAGAGQLPHPALTAPPASPPLMVQIAAVSNRDDAEVLVNALRKRNYPVTARREPGDTFIHVRIGPFATRAIADQWRMKLLNDGYNAIIQP